MRQAVVKKIGVELEEVPAPVLEVGSVLVRVVRSCISIGTDTSNVKDAGKSIVQRVVEKPQQVKKVMNMLSGNGLRRTINQVKQKLGEGKPIGYSAAGVVVEVHERETFFKVGDRVACAGAGVANHADYVLVPNNLVTKVPEALDFESASTVTLGAIAMQGIRRAKPTMGESFAVIGLGLLGQLTVQLLKANGCRVVGIDLDKDRNRLAAELGAHLTLCPDDDVNNAIQSFSDNFGIDGVVITAASLSSDIVSQAFQMCRKKGRVILVGDVGLNLKREDFYKNEIDFLISSSYGPGRYDSNYEEKGLDYPISYVRWTENRNMQEYLRLLDEKSINVKPLIDEIVPIEKINDVYQGLLKNEKKPLAIILSYESEDQKLVHKVKNTLVNKNRNLNGKIKTAVVGAGNFAKGMHLPNLAKLKNQYALSAVVSRTGLNAKNTAASFESQYCTTEFADILEDDAIDFVVITTRHNLHADQALACLNVGKHVLLEKPMALNMDELNRFKDFYSDGFENKPILTVGFNRRFSPLIFKVKEFLSRREGPMIINYRMNAGFIDASHWVHGEEGGGRNIGEACHIYDLFLFLCESGVREVQASSISPLKEEYGKKNENFIATISFDDGSIATLTYTSLGSKKLSKEYMEIFFEGKSVVLDDYKSLSIFDGKHEKQLRENIQDKGQLNELKEIAKYLAEGRGFVIPFEQQIKGAEISFEIEKFLK